MEKIKKAPAYPASLLNYLQTKVIFSLPNPFWDLLKRVHDEAGFACQFAGWYLTETGMISLRRYRKPALQEDQVCENHKQFLRMPSHDKRGFPKYQGYHAGVSGVYRLRKK